MSELAAELKYYQIKFFQDIQFTIDIACQSILNKRKNEGLPYKKYEKRYIDEYIKNLKAVEDASIKKLNMFIEKKGDQLEKLTRDQIFLQAGCESVVYVEHDDIDNKYYQEIFHWQDPFDEFVIGAFVHSTFWLNPNQVNYIRFKLQCTKIENINITLDQVFIFNINLFSQLF